MPLIPSLRGRGHRLERLGDEELMARVRRRDAGAFAVVFDRHAGPAYSLALRMSGDPGLAEDVVQEVFTGLWRGVGDFRPERGSLRSWLLTAVRNRMIDAFRTRSAKQAADVPDEGLAERLAGPADPAAEVAERETALAVRTAVGELPAEQREVIELAFFGGFTHTEIAERLGLPAGTVKGRMRLGLTKLHGALAAPVNSVL